MICGSKLKLQSTLGCERNVGGLSDQHVLQRDSWEPFPDATTDKM